MLTVYRDSNEKYGRPDHWHFRTEPHYHPDLAQAPRDSTVLDLRRTDLNWRALADFPALEEVTGQGLSREQVEFLAQLPGLKRLRLSGLRGLDLSSLAPAINLEELAFISISGPRSVEPLLHLPRLRSVYFESLPKLADFSALRDAKGLRCLCITSGTERPQDIEDLSFLQGMTALQHLMLGQVRYLGKGPAFRGLVGLPNLQSVAVYPAFMPLSDLVFLQARLGHITGVETQTFVIKGMGERGLPLEKLDSAPPDEVVTVYFAGKGEREYTGPAVKARDRIRQHMDRVAAMMRE